MDFGCFRFLKSVSGAFVFRHIDEQAFGQYPRPSAGVQEKWVSESLSTNLSPGA